MKGLSRTAALSPKSASWSLYNPDDLAGRLGLPVSVVDTALEKTGFNKAVRIREGVIRLKTRLIEEARGLSREHQELTHRRLCVKRRLLFVQEELRNVRNILRIPRENPGGGQP